MAEVEDVLSDTARHATIFMRRLWRRYRPLPGAPRTVVLIDMAPRLDLLITAYLGQGLRLRTAQDPPHPTLLSRIFRRVQSPWLKASIPATDGSSIWLPADSGIENQEEGVDLYRVMALIQAERVLRGSVTVFDPNWPPLLADAYLLHEAWAADFSLVEKMPGMARALRSLRTLALRRRPPLDAFSPRRQPLERCLRELLQTEPGADSVQLPRSPGPEDSVKLASAFLSELGLESTERGLGNAPLLKDWWTGALRPASSGDGIRAGKGYEDEGSAEASAPQDERTRSARLSRRPEIREADEDEDDQRGEGIFLIQHDEPHQQAEDPFGLNRPVDRDEEASADEYSDMVSELSEARLIATSGRPKEVLLSDDPPDAHTALQLKRAKREQKGLSYPEWDYRTNTYREPGAHVYLLPNLSGSEQWVDATLEEHRGLLHPIRRRFEMLSAARVTRRRLFDGDEIDLAAYVEGYADFRAGGPLPEALYQTRRVAERDLAITLLIDISGSTDAWIGAHRRIIDVEREALLLVSVALDGMGEPWSILAFSGEGPDSVIVREVKRFEEAYGREIALRISSLEPEQYTRVGAAIRHATAGLMRQPASHRLLLLLSDGKPNDRDQYEGRYGVEDARQAVHEAKLQGISTFCLTIDRQAPNYLPRIFGAHHYALLPRPEHLPMALLDWMKRLIAR